MSRSELMLAAEVETRLLVLYILLFAHCFFLLFHAWGLFDWCLPYGRFRVIVIACKALFISWISCGGCRGYGFEDSGFMCAIYPRCLLFYFIFACFMKTFSTLLLGGS